MEEVRKVPDPIRDDLGNEIPRTEENGESKDVDVPIPVSGGTPAEGGTPVLLTINKDGSVQATGDPAVSLADVPGNMHQLNISRLEGAGASAHEHFVTFNKILDLGFETDRHVVTLQQALGVREVTSKAGQIGIPIAGAGAAA